MDFEDSIFIREFTDCINALIFARGITERAEADVIMGDLVLEATKSVANDASLVPQELRQAISAELTEWKGQQNVNTGMVQSEIASALGDQFARADECISFAELIVVRLEYLMGDNIDLLLSKKPRPHPEVVTGAMLKCLLLLSFQSKICMITQEIFHLMKHGFLDGADSRLRTLHEHVVNYVLLINDRTYEICERYQAHAAFEALERMKAYRRNSQESMYRIDPETSQKLDRDIAEAELAAADARASWGPDISENYGWARPGLPGRVRRKPVIRFTDLERASGADHLRGNYLTGNNAVHAGAFSVISHLNIGGSRLLKPMEYLDIKRVANIGACALRYLRDSARLTARGIPYEIEEYDEFLIACEMVRMADAVIDDFSAAMDNSEAPSARQDPAPSAPT